MASEGRLACSDLGGQRPGAGRCRGLFQSGDESRRVDRVKFKITSRVLPSCLGVASLGTIHTTDDLRKNRERANIGKAFALECAYT